MKDDAQSQPFGSGPGLRALPANFLRNHHNFDFLQDHQPSRRFMLDRKGTLSPQPGRLGGSAGISGSADLGRFYKS